MTRYTAGLAVLSMALVMITLAVVAGSQNQTAAWQILCAAGLVTGTVQAIYVCTSMWGSP